MNRNISKRLRIMEEAGMLQEREREALALVVQLLECEYGIKVVGDNGEIFVSHMAMLMIRRRTNQQVPPLDPAIMTSLREDPRFEPSREIANSITRSCGLQITENEGVYVRMHLCALMIAP